MNAQLLNLFGLRGLLNENLIFIMITYIVFVFIAGIVAKAIGDGLRNPIHQIRNASYLHFASVSVFFVGFFGSINFSYNMKYLIVLSLPLGIVAFILSFRESNNLSENLASDEDILDNI